jgi:hypothetical protein
MGKEKLLLAHAKMKVGVRVGKTEPLEENSFCHKNI